MQANFSWILYTESYHYLTEVKSLVRYFQVAQGIFLISCMLGFMLPKLSSAIQLLFSKLFFTFER